MAFDAHKNLAIGTVAAAPGTAGLSLTVGSGEGARFPAAPFNATVWPASQAATPVNAEIVRVTARAGDVFTITRAQEGTTAKPIAIGYLIANTATAKTFTDIEAQVGGGWQDVPFLASNFSAQSPMTWTVGAGAIVRNRYALTGKTLLWSFYVSWFSGGNVLGGSPSSALVMKLPGGLTAAASQIALLDYTPGVTGIAAAGGLYASTSGQTLLVQKVNNANFALADVPGIVANVMLEVQ